MTDPHYARSMAELPDLNALAARTGMEFIQDIVDGTMAGPPIGETLGFWPVKAEEGLVVFEGTPQFNAANPLRTVHGGLVWRDPRQLHGLRGADHPAPGQGLYDA